MKLFTLQIAALVGLVQGSIDLGLFDKRDRCMEELGCFPITSDLYHPLWRAINAQVDPREMINTTFLFYTRENMNEPDYRVGHRIHSNGLDKVHFNPELPTKIVIHGFLDTQFFGAWMSELKTELLKLGDFNVIVVDWMGGNSLPYTQATANTRVVGAEVAVLIQKLMDHFHVAESSFHLYGHSLGAHVCGYAGDRHGGRISRITAMDAAEPYFQHMPNSVRLDTSDAQFVEAVHSDARNFVTTLGFGFTDPIGHLDFYPNGGEKMPGCGLIDRVIELKETGVRGIVKLAACNHVMAISYVKDFVRHEGRCVPIGFDCPSYDLFEHGQCYDCGADGSRCAPAGFESMDYFKRFANASRPTKMYFNTAPKSHYCLFHYHVQIKMRRFTRANPTKVASAVSGKYYLNVKGDKASYEFNLQPSVSTLHPGSSNNVLVTTAVDLGEIQEVTLRYVANSIFFPPQMELESVKMTPMNVPVKRAELRVRTSTVCPSEPLQNRKITILSKENCSRS